MNWIEFGDRDNYLVILRFGRKKSGILLCVKTTKSKQSPPHREKTSSREEAATYIPKNPSINNDTADLEPVRGIFDLDSFDVTIFEDVMVLFKLINIK